MYLLDWEVGLCLYYVVAEALLDSLASPYRYFAIMRHEWPKRGTFGVLPHAIFAGGMQLVVIAMPCFVVFAMAGQLIQGGGRNRDTRA